MFAVFGAVLELIWNHVIERFKLSSELTGCALFCSRCMSGSYFTVSRHKINPGCSRLLSVLCFLRCCINGDYHWIFVPDIFQEAGLPLWLRPYEVLCTSSYTALIETIPDTVILLRISSLLKLLHLSLLVFRYSMI